MDKRRGSESPPDLRDSLLEDPGEIAAKESENALLQFDAANKLILDQTQTGEALILRPSLVCEYNRYAIQGIWRSAGTYRTHAICIRGSCHVPPPHEDVPRLMEEMCDYINNGREVHSMFHTAAYVMWRINWIHPFVEGNGRTARIVSYIELCCRLGFLLPGIKTIPEQIAEDRNARYYSGLDAADAAFARGRPDVSDLEDMISTYLARQLLDIHDQASAHPSDA